MDLENAVFCNIFLSMSIYYLDNLYNCFGVIGNSDEVEILLTKLNSKKIESSRVK